MTDHNEETPSEAATVPEPAMSERQVLANRQNAQASTGPATAEGKVRSSRNALKHGLYASGSRAVHRGALRENQAELDRKLDVLARSLLPRDAIEEAQAIRIASILHQMDRLDVIEANVLAADTVADLPVDPELLFAAQEACHQLAGAHAFVHWLQEGQPTLSKAQANQITDHIIWYRLDRVIPAELLGADPDRPAMDPLDKMRLMMHEGFTGNSAKAVQWAEAQLIEMEDLIAGIQCAEAEATAQRMLISIERVSRIKSRYGGDLARAVALYLVLRGRSLEEPEEGRKANKPAEIEQ